MPGPTVNTCHPLPHFTLLTQEARTIIISTLKTGPGLREVEKFLRSLSCSGAELEVSLRCVTSEHKASTSEFFLTASWLSPPGPAALPRLASRAQSGLSYLLPSTAARQCPVPFPSSGVSF